MGATATGNYQPCGTTTLAGTGTIVGQGKKPVLWALLSTSDASSYSPVFTDVSDDVRAYSTSRGRESELSDFDAGTCTVTFDNRQNKYDPNYLSTIRPQNQIKLFEQFNGLTNPVFAGWADAWDLQWPGTGSSDAVSVGSFTDEFKNLNLARLPTMNPPRDTYADLVAYDQPSGFWPMDDVAAAKVAQGNPGPSLGYFAAGGSLTVAQALIRGEWVDAGRGALVLDDAGLFGCNVEESGAGDVGGLTAFSFETWFAFSAVPSGADRSIGNTGTGGGPGDRWNLELRTSGVLRFSCTNSVPTTTSVSTAKLEAGTGYHIVCTYDGANIKIYLNGTQAASTAHTGAFTAYAGTEDFELGVNEAGSDWTYDSVAFYRHALSATRIAAHYQAGNQRGIGLATGGATAASYVIGQILDAVENHASRNIRAASRAVIPTFMRGQDALGEIRRARSAEAVDSMFFIAADGTATFLDAAHRSASPWNTTQYTFGDEGTAGQLPYEDLDVDYSESFLFNEWNITRTGGLVQTRSDTTSITRYFKRSQSLTDVPVSSDVTADDIAVAELAKFKDPMFRALSLSLTSADLNVLDAMFQLEIGDRIRIIRTLPGPAGWFDQTVYVQKIQVDADNMQGPWRVTLGVSPV